LRIKKNPKYNKKYNLKKVKEIKAALYEGKRKISIVDIPKPVPKTGEVLVKIKYTGICGSELEAYKTGLYPLPVVMGHEASGVIEELGPEVKKLKPGSRVSIDSIMPCGKCYGCLRGYTNICKDEVNAFGIFKNGGFAEYVSVPASSLVTIPDSIPDKFGTVFDQIGTGLFAIREANFTVGQTAVIVGLGTLGQFQLQLLKLSGASKVIVIEKNKHRLDVAKKFNPDLALNKISLTRVKGATKRIGADFVFECTGVPDVINFTSSLVRRGGTIVQIGLCEKQFEIKFLPFVMNHNRIQGIIGFLRQDFEYALELVAKKLIDPEPIVTKIISLDDIVEEGFERALDPETQDIKFIVEP
jgi:(R,R)-butanediol dehydrogenase/meso-butanediol dehydrogenase/diacetyl reductase